MKFLNTSLFVSDIVVTAIGYREFIRWIQDKASTRGGAWRFFFYHPEIVAVAHLQAGSHYHLNQFSRRPEKIVDISDFRSLMVQLFVVSILWVHFKKADDWQSDYHHEAYTGNIDEEEFVAAARSFSAAYGQAQLSEEEIRNDYRMLGEQTEGPITFVQVRLSLPD